jgi:hypothetical protein
VRRPGVLIFSDRRSPSIFLISSADSTLGIFWFSPSAASSCCCCQPSGQIRSFFLLASQREVRFPSLVFCRQHFALVLLAAAGIPFFAARIIFVCFKVLLSRQGNVLPVCSPAAGTGLAGSVLPPSVPACDFLPARIAELLLQFPPFERGVGLTCLIVVALRPGLCFLV